MVFRHQSRLHVSQLVRPHGLIILGMRCVVGQGGFDVLWEDCTD